MNYPASNGDPRPGGLLFCYPLGTPTKFEPVSGSDVSMIGDQVQSGLVKFQCISVMKKYENKSLEELRMADYPKNRSLVLGNRFTRLPAKPLFHVATGATAGKEERSTTPLLAKQTRVKPPPEPVPQTKDPSRYQRTVRVVVPLTPPESHRRTVHLVDEKDANIERRKRERDFQTEEDMEMLREKCRKLTAEKRGLRDDNHRLTKDNDRLSKDNDNLSKDNGHLVEEENQTLREKCRKLLEEKKSLMRDNDRLSEDKNRLSKDQDRLVEDKKYLLKHRDRLVEDKNRLGKEKNRLTKDNDRLKQDNNRLADSLKKREEKKEIVDDLLREKENLEDRLRCSICMDEKKDAVLDCGHVACRRCAAKLTLCHLCGARISTVRFMFLD